MRVEEAKWIGEVLSNLPAESISPVLELGSSTLTFRSVEKPHIDKFIHAPLRKKGVQIVHSDIKEGEGIDISGDIYQPETIAKLLDVKAKCVLCCNIFEHVTNREQFAQTCDRLLQPGGYTVVTVPQSYPYHLDPIDTYYRPASPQLANLFPGYSEVQSATIPSTTFCQDIAAMPHPVAFAVREWVKILLVRGGLEATKARAHRWLWLFRPYLITAIILKKNHA